MSILVDKGFACRKHVNLIVAISTGAHMRMSLEGCQILRSTLASWCTHDHVPAA